MAYCYVVVGTEIPIVGVWSARQEAINEAIEHCKDSGVTEYKVHDINKELVVIKPIKGDILEEAKIYRYEVQ